MSILTLSPVGGILRTPIRIENGQLIIQISSPLGKWLDLLQSILAGVGPQLRTHATLDFPNTAAGTSSTLTIPLPGAEPGQSVTVGTPGVPANSLYTAFVSSGGDEVTVQFNNYSAGAIDPASGDFTVIVHT